VVVTGAADLADSVASFLLDQGAPGLQTEEIGDTVRLTAHFSEPPPAAVVDAFCQTLPEAFPGIAVPQVQYESVADAAWAESWKEHFPPLEVGDRMFVHPPWVSEIPAGRIGVRIDPCMAFGTGQHASTRGCLELLEEAMRSTRVSRVLDIGTGSGILAIAAAKLGAQEICAVDIDVDACRVAAENAAVNEVAEHIRVFDSLDAVKGTFEVVLANMFAPQLVELTHEITERLTPDGWAIGSGILLDEAGSVIDAWSGAGLRLHTRRPEAEWVTLAFRRAPDS
jgi:ribosomal protein L11 methyltransferase